MSARRRTVDLLSRLLGLRCPSVFHVPGELVPQFCTGRPGHTGTGGTTAVLHGNGRTAWGDGIADDNHPATPVILRTSVLRSQLNEALQRVAAQQMMISARDHVILVTASTAPTCGELLRVLTTLRDETGSPLADEALGLARIWEESLDHLHTCTSLTDHD